MQSDDNAPDISRRHFISMTTGLAASLALAGCGGGKGTAILPGSPLNSAVLDSRGGIVQYQQAGIKLAFPEDAFGKATRVTIDPQPTIPDLTPLITEANGPVFRISFEDSESRSRQVSNAKTYATLEMTLPDGFDSKYSDIYLHRADGKIPYLLGAYIDSASHKMYAVIPLALFEQTFTAPSSGRAESGFSVIRECSLGITRLRAVNESSGGATIAKQTFSGRTWQHDNWNSVNSIGVENLPGKRIAVVVHGTYSMLTELDELPVYLTDLPEVNGGEQKFFDRVIGIDYESVNVAPDTNGQLLANALHPMLDAGAKVYMFAHSQGGLVCRWAIEKAGAGEVTALFMFGTPNDGVSWLASAALASIKTGLYNDFGIGDGPVSPLAPALTAMGFKPGIPFFHPEPFYSAFNRALNSSPTPRKTAYYTITGNLPHFGTIAAVDIAAFILGKNPKFLAAATVAIVASFLVGDGTLFLTGGDDDGVVYVDSALLVRGGTSQLPFYNRVNPMGIRNKTVSLSHTRLPLIQSHPEEIGLQVTQWIYDEGYGKTDVTVS